MAPPVTIKHRSLPRLRRRWRWVLRLVWITGWAGTVVLLGLCAVIERYGATDRVHSADVIVVLGGGEDGTLRRAQHAAVLYTQGFAPVLVCTGGAAREGAISEAERCQQAALEHGVPQAAIIVEPHSLSTEQNAIAVAALAQDYGWQNALLVSDNYHLWRAHWLFEREGLRNWTSPAQVTTGALRSWEEARSVLREAAATTWYVAKTLLDLPITNFPGM